MLINSVKDVASALNHLINVTKSASGKPIEDPEMKKLKESAKIMVTNVTSLLRTVKTVEDEAQRGTNALEGTIESISQELQMHSHERIPTTRTTPEDLIRVTKQVGRRDTILELESTCRALDYHRHLEGCLSRSDVPTG